MLRLARQLRQPCFRLSGPGTYIAELSSSVFRRTYQKCRTVTQHRFIRCSPSAVLTTAHVGHNLSDGRNFDTIQHWRRPADSERGNSVHWYDHIPVLGEIGCCLSVDNGANGAIVHLIATPHHQRKVLPRPLMRFALSSWSHRKLVGIAKIAEAQAVDLGEVSHT
jgi:hypothetical protein